MKKLLYLLLLLLVLGSCKNHIYSTYYGEVDIDTLEVMLRTEEGYPCYKVKTIERDSFILDDQVKYLPCPQQILYCPEKNCYYKLEPAAHGETAVYDFDPTFDYDYWLK